MDFDSARIERRPEVRAADSSGDNSSRARTAAGVSRRRVLRLLAAGGAAVVGLAACEETPPAASPTRPAAASKVIVTAPPSPTPRPTATLAPTATAEPAPTATAEPTPRPAVAATPVSDDGRLSDHQARSLLDGLLLDPTYPEAQVELVAYMGTTGDERLISVLIEVLRAAQLGAFHPDSLGNAQEGLFQLTGERLDSWAEWAEWYARSDLTTVPGFAAWKGRIYSRIDPDFARFFDEDAPRSIRFEEIVWGGVHLDGIPPLESAPMVAAHNAAYLEPEDVVFGVAINGDYRAYPLRIMDWHEMANDEVGGEPVALAYCTLCGAGVLFSRRHRGKVLSIGTSGFLMRSNKLMYDRGTFTLWNQLTGEPVLGPLAADPEQLDVIPIVTTTWEAWRTANPTTVVLSVDTGHRRDYSPGAAYGGYFASDDLMFPAPTADGLAPKDRVFALVLGDAARAYPVPVLVEARVLNDAVDAQPVVLVALGGELTVEGFDRRAGPVAWSAGAAVRAFDRGERKFEAGSDTRTVVDEQGTVWQVTEEALIHPDGTQLPRLPGHLAYWLGWSSFHPATTLYGADQG